MLEPLAMADHRYPSLTNLSRSLAFSLLDENGAETPLEVNSTDPFEFFIPRDPQSIVPLLFPHNVTSIDARPYLFHFHSNNLTHDDPNVTLSVHLDMRPVNNSLAYLLIYQFDDTPQIDSIGDRWMPFCPKSKFHRRSAAVRISVPHVDLNVDGLHTHFLNNQQTANHRSIAYGLRQLNAFETDSYCANETLREVRLDILEPTVFSANYETRIYQSACLYLDSDGNWQSDGLVVSALRYARKDIEPV